MDKAGRVDGQPTLLARIKDRPLPVGIGLVGIGLGGFALSKTLHHPFARLSAVALNTAGFGYWLHKSYALTHVKPKSPTSPPKEPAQKEAARCRDWLDATPQEVNHGEEFKLPRVQVRLRLAITPSPEQAVAWRACWRTATGDLIQENDQMRPVTLALPGGVNFPGWFAQSLLPTSLMPSDRQTKTAWMIWESEDHNRTGCQVILEKAPLNKGI